MQLVPSVGSQRERLAILIGIVSLERGENVNVNITEVRGKMRDYPDILELKDYSHISDPKTRKELDYHFIRNPNQGLKTYMMKNANKMQLTDDITLVLSVVPRGIRGSILYSVQIKKS
jgi:hypothetical protein